MPLALFEVLAAVVVVLTLGAFVFAKTESHLLRSYLALAVSSYIGEETCIRFYEYYLYKPSLWEKSQWHFLVDYVPALVPLIWPLVILSARQAVKALFPMATGAKLALFVALVVCFDASLVEVLAVRSHYWVWKTGGHLGVPYIGILGWGYFTFGAVYALERADNLFGLLAVPLYGFVATHGLILATWWGLFRYLPDVSDPVKHAFPAFVLVSLLALAVAFTRRRRGFAIPMTVAGPRLIAASLFFALLWLVARREPSYWVHTALVAVPYFVATRFSSATRST
ncbi:MAG: hypothetical protein U0174_01635 [Polyangiaceae bacterium]